MTNPVFFLLTDRNPSLSLRAIISKPAGVHQLWCASLEPRALRHTQSDHEVHLSFGLRRCFSIALQGFVEFRMSGTVQLDVDTMNGEEGPVSQAGRSAALLCSS